LPVRWSLFSVPLVPANPYFEILTALARAKVDFIVGGGVACVLHGVERVTMDVDLAVLMQPANLNGFLGVMRKLGLNPRVPIPPETLLQPETIRMLVEEKQALVFTFLDPDRPVRQVDIFPRPDLSYESLLPDAEWIELNQVRVRVIGRRRLLAIKLGIQPPRLKDAMDIDYLRRHVD
jgi:hypothetical protein